MSQHNSCSKLNHSLGLLTPNRYESDLSNEAQYILVSQEDAKIFKVKVGGHKENCQLGQLEPDAPGAG